jgi:hypothetical protein
MSGGIGGEFSVAAVRPPRYFTGLTSQAKRYWKDGVPVRPSLSLGLERSPILLLSQMEFEIRSARLAAYGDNIASLSLSYEVTCGHCFQKDGAVAEGVVGDGEPEKLACDQGWEVGSTKSGHGENG